MKRRLSLLLALALLTLSLTACTPPARSGKLSVVTTIFPAYDWARNIIGEDAEDVSLTMLLDKGADLHSFQPTAADILKVATCDLFIYVGGESDEWVKDALAESTNKDMIVINLIEVLGDDAREEEIVEGMQIDAAEAAPGDEDDDNDGGYEIVYDEHVWLSLRNAAVCCDAIAEALGRLDRANAGAYAASAAAYKEKLSSLDERYEAAVSSAKRKTVLFGDRFPFRYLADDYGLVYYAAFVGCSAETEASFATITFLSGKVDELSLPAVFTIDGSDGKLADTIVRNTKAKDQKILALDSMQSTTAKDVADGVTYLSVMEKNLAVLSEALR